MSSAQGVSASFDSLPSHIQALIFASAGACLTTCKASAALAQDARLAAKWLLQQHLSQPLEYAAKHRLWDVCNQLLDTFSYQPKEQELCSGMFYSGMYGGATLMCRVLQWSCQEQHTGCEVCCSVQETLQLAASGGHIDMVSLLLSHPSCTAQAVRDAVREAVCWEQLEVLQMLVSRCPDAGSPKLSGSPMLDATMCGNIAAMEVLVQHGADVNGSKGSPWQSDAESSLARRPPLWVAVMEEQVAAVGWLLQQGITAEGSGLGPALELAARKADPTLIRMLLSYSPIQAIIPSYGPSALLRAVQSGRAAVAEELLKAGVPTTAQAIQHAEGVDGEMEVREMFRNCVSNAQAYAQSPAILQAAVEHGHTEFAQLLREAMDWREALRRGQQ
jgi:hypothetical protein